MKKIKFFGTIIATALIVSACTNDVGSNANSGNGVLSSASDETCITSVPITKAEYEGSGTEYTGSALVTIAEGITLGKLKSNDRELNFSDDVAPGTITLMVKNGNVYTAYTFDAACMQGKSHLFDGKNVSGIKYGAFVPAPTEPETKGLSGNLIVNIPCAEGQKVIVDYVVTGYENWTNDGTETGQLVSKIPYETLGNNNGGMIVQVSLYGVEGTIQSFYPTWDGVNDVVVDYDCSALTPGGDETPHFVSAVVTSFSTNLQNGNNNNFKFSVTVTMSDGSTLVEDHTETINAQQSGSKTFVYANYSVFVQWNGNNKVTTCRVL